MRPLRHELMAEAGTEARPTEHFHKSCSPNTLNIRVILNGACVGCVLRTDFASLHPALLLEGQVGLVDLPPGNLEIPGHLVRQAPPP